MSTEIRSRLVQMLSDIIREPLPAEGRIERANVPRWDSLNHMILIVTVEEELGVRLSAEDVQAISSIDDLVGLVTRPQ